MSHRKLVTGNAVMVAIDMCGKKKQLWESRYSELLENTCILKFQFILL